MPHQGAIDPEEAARQLAAIDGTSVEDARAKVGLPMVEAVSLDSAETIAAQAAYSTPGMLPEGVTMEPPAPASNPNFSAPTSSQVDREEMMVDLAHRFTYHPPKGDQAERYTVLREMARKLAETIVEFSPGRSRERALAITHLEQAIMWANASIARRK